MSEYWKILIKYFWWVSEALGIRWAPRHVPGSRRLQTLAAAGWIGVVLFGELVCIFLYFKLLYSSLWWLALLYAVWMLNDVQICHKGGRRFEWVRSWSWWQYYRDYFPLKLVKSDDCGDLDPEKNYLFACFPHGVVCAGAFGAFATNALGFRELFPGMKSYMITLGGHFVVPFFRDFIMALGGNAASRESLLELLDGRRRRGSCVALIVGGAAEALDAHPGEYKILISRRKGFIRVAMKAGAPLVPVFSFGEPDVFRPVYNPDNSFLRKFQEKFRQVTGISPILPLGRGIFQYSFGLLPLRKSVTTVVGAPMEVVRNADPTDEEVNAVHAEFTKRLTQLFENEKSKYLKNHQDIHLILT
ncbi:2-acylglycerol O-acyltransferase 2-A isoform X1 [Plutella xylostella]|uniref:2-acylglycerol O-acyltransferase 2-A isoform X1 n=1 Tax=Plutella xylostella TaxID=51655 RepID=UPI0005D0547B|nr:2-acylglycerol O-acyltransferase 2-A isoform X1 [Plutella xylostella]